MKHYDLTFNNHGTISVWNDNFFERMGDTRGDYLFFGNKSATYRIHASEYNYNKFHKEAFDKFLRKTKCAIIT